VNRLRPTGDRPAAVPGAVSGDVEVSVALAVNPHRVLRLLLGLAGTLSALGLVVMLLQRGAGIDSGAFKIVDLDQERNLPTWFSSLLLASAAGLFALHARRDRTRRTGWAGLAAIFAILSLDEFGSLHEELGQDLDLSGPLLFAWVVPGALAVVALGLVYLPFLIRLPAPTRARIVLAGTLYVGGALGFEMLNAAVVSARGSDTGILVGLVTQGEETLEMLGATVLVFALLAHFGVRGEVSGTPEDVPAPR